MNHKPTLIVPARYANDEKLTDAYLRGIDHGSGFAENNVPTLGDKVIAGDLGRVTVDEENIREVHANLCYEAESNSRDYSPFEFTAHAFNSDDDSEALWEAFDEGYGDKICADLEAYTDKDYGIDEFKLGENAPDGFEDYHNSAGD